MVANSRTFLKAASALALTLAIAAPGVQAQQYPVNTPASSSGGTRTAVASINLNNIQNQINYVSNVANNAQNTANNAQSTADYGVHVGSNAWNQAVYASNLAQDARNVAGSATGYGSAERFFDVQDSSAQLKGACLRGYSNFSVAGQWVCPNGTGPFITTNTGLGGSGGH